MLEIFAIVLALLLVAQLLLALQQLAQARAWRRRRREEATRARFAEARQLLWEAVLSEELSIDTATFQATNHILTGVMRRPDQFHLLAATFLRSRAEQVNGEAELSELGRRMRAECSGWSERTEQVLDKLADGIDHLILEWSWAVRLVDAAERRFRLVSGLLLARRLKERVVRYARKHDSRVGMLYETRGEIGAMLSAA